MLNFISGILGKGTVARGAMIVMLSSVISGVVGFALIPVWTHFLTPKEFGLYGLILASSNLVQGIAGLGIGAALGRFVHDDLSNEDHVGKLVANSLKLTMGLSSLLCILAVFIVTFYLKGEDPDLWIYVLLGMACSWFGIMSIQARTLFVAHEKHHLNALCNIASLLLGVSIAVGLLVWNEMGVMARFLGNFAGSGIIGSILLVWLIKKYYRFPWDRKLSKTILIYGAPLVVHTLASILLAIGDRFILESMLGLASVGFYTVAYTFSKPLEFVVHAISQAWSPRFFKEMANGEIGDKNIRRFNCVWTLVMGSILCGITLLGPHAFHYLVESGYASASEVLAPVFAGIFLMGTYHLSVGPIYYAKKPRLVATVTLVSALVNIGANMVMIPWFGIIGAAYGTMLSYAVMSLSVSYLSRKFHPQIDQIVRLWPWFIALICFSIVSWEKIGYEFGWVSAVALVFVMAWIFKDEIMQKSLSDV